MTVSYGQGLHRHLPFDCQGYEVKPGTNALISATDYAGKTDTSAFRFVPSISCFFFVFFFFFLRFLRNATDFGDKFLVTALTCNFASFGEKKSKWTPLISINYHIECAL